MIYVSQCSKVLISIFDTPKKLILATFISILLMAILWDLAEDNNSDVDDTVNILIFFKQNKLKKIYKKNKLRIESKLVFFELFKNFNG